MHVCTYTHLYIHIYFTAYGPPKHHFSFKKNFNLKKQHSFRERWRSILLIRLHNSGVKPVIHTDTRKCIDNTKNKHIHSSSVRGLNHHYSKHG